MFQSFVPKLRPVANDLSRSFGSRMTSAPMPMPGDQRPAQRVGAVELHDVERIDAVAERLGHLAVLRVAHGAVQVHRVERRAPHELVARHDHARHPEEQDLRARSRACRSDRTRARSGDCLVRPAERGDRPEPRREPRVEHVLVLAHRAAAVRALRDVVAAHDDVLRRIAVVAVPHRHAMSPPELPRDVPVANARRASSRTPLPSARAECGSRRRARPASAGAASGSIFTNHWSESRGSTTVSQR